MVLADPSRSSNGLPREWYRIIRSPTVVQTAILSFRTRHSLAAQYAANPPFCKSEAGLRALAQSWKDWLANGGSVYELQTAYTAATRRNHCEYRLAIVASSGLELSNLIDAWLRGEKRREVHSSHVRNADRLRTAFVFNGMGSQWKEWVPNF